MNNIFSGLFTTTDGATVSSFLLCMGAALIIGAVFAFIAAQDAKSTKSFQLTIALLPAIVCVVIMMVNGNVGAGVAVAGAFSLVRFRSNPGTAKEIAVIFMAMCAGLITGMGYIFYAFAFAVIMSIMLLIYSSVNFSSKKEVCKTLRIAIPEDLNYTDVFDDLFKIHTKSYEMVDVRTANMGSIYKLKYDIVMKEANGEKAFIDELRKRNGNLEISICRQDKTTTEM